MDWTYLPESDGNDDIWYLVPPAEGSDLWHTIDAIVGRHHDGGWYVEADIRPHDRRGQEPVLFTRAGYCYAHQAMRDAERVFERFAHQHTV